MCSHPAHSWGPNTKASRAWRPKPQQLDQRATTWLPVPWMYLWCSNTLSLSRNTPTTFTDYLQKHFIFHQKHHSRPSVSVCVRPSWSYVLLSLWKKKKKNPFQGLFPKVLLRFLFRGYERKPWQAAVFHEVSKQGIPSGVWDLWEHWLIK